MLHHFYRDAIDASALAQAEAIERFAEWTGAPHEEPSHVRIGRLLELAKEMGVKIPPHPRYPRQKATRRWECICTAIAENRPIPRSKAELPLTVEDQQRRNAKRMQRWEAIKRMGKLSPSETVTLAEAATISGASLRRLQRLAQTGQLPAEKRFISTVKNCPGRGQFFTTVGAVRRYLASRPTAA